MRAAARSYRRHMRDCARMSHLDVWYSRIGEKDILTAMSPEAREGARSVMAKARRRNHMQVLEKMAELVDDQHHIVEDRPLIVRETHTAEGHPIARRSTTRCIAISTRCRKIARCSFRGTACSMSRARSWG